MSEDKKLNTIIITENKSLGFNPFTDLPLAMGVTGFVYPAQGLNLDLLQEKLLGENREEYILAINDLLRGEPPKKV
jgi:hypothetical protein